MEYKKLISYTRDNDIFTTLDSEGNTITWRTQEISMGYYLDTPSLLYGVFFCDDSNIALTICDIWGCAYHKSCRMPICPTLDLLEEVLKCRIAYNLTGVLKQPDWELMP